MIFKMFSSIWHIHHVNAFDSRDVLLRFNDEGAELRDHVARHLTDARSPRRMSARTLVARRRSCNVGAGSLWQCCEPGSEAKAPRKAQSR